MKDRIVKKDVVEKSKLDSKLFKYTLSDLIIQSVYQSNDYYLKEAQKRLYYCGFSPNVINELIKSELNLSRLKDNKIIIEKKFIDNNFMIDSLKKNKEKLMLSELLCIIDECVMIGKYYSSNFTRNVALEIEPLSKENLSNFLMKEFYDRIESMFRNVNNLNLKFKGYINEEQIGSLYENEMKIIIKNRWSDVLDIDFVPYDIEKICL